MSITITVPDDIARAAEELARVSGTSAEELLLEALKAHFPPVPESLQSELDAWNLASDTDMARLDAAEGLA
jgi:predicted transcriptional regulator